MMVDAKKRILCHLAAATIGFGPAGATAADTLELESVPESLLDDCLDDVEGEGWGSSDLAVLVSMLSEDSRKTVRVRLTHLLGQLEYAGLNDSVQEAYLSLVCDKDPMVRKAAFAGVAKWFENLNALERTTVVTEWSLSEKTAVREAIARVLASRRAGVQLGADLAVDHLSRDPGWRVRRAVARAARTRYGENPASYGDVLDRLSRDVHRLVRRTAKSSRELVMLSQLGSELSA